MYEIKNNVNGKIYVGVHKTSNEDDGYMGSGKVIRSAIAKYGLENFTKTILERFETAEAMFEREKEFVNEEFLSRRDVYNLRRGGFGGFDHVNKSMSDDERKIRAVKMHLVIKDNRKDAEYNLKYIDKKKTTLKEIRSRNSRWKFNAERNIEFSKRAQAPEAIAKKVATFEKIEHQKGSKNSQFGSMWITNGIENKKIEKECPIPEGWIKGRK